MKDRVNYLLTRVDSFYPDFFDTDINHPPTDKTIRIFLKQMILDNSCVKDRIQCLKTKDNEQKNEDIQWLGLYYMTKAFQNAQANTLIEKLVIILKVPYHDFDQFVGSAKFYYLSKVWNLLDRPLDLTYHILQFLEEWPTMDGLVELFFNLLETKQDLNQILLHLHPFMPMGLTPFFELALFYHNCHQLGMDILTSYNILLNSVDEKSNEKKEHEEILQFLHKANPNKKFVIRSNEKQHKEIVITDLLYARSKKSPLQSLYIEKIKINLFNWNQHKFEKNHFWNQFGYTHIQMKLANQRAQLEYEEIVKVELIYEKNRNKKKQIILNQIRVNMQNIIVNADKYKQLATIVVQTANQAYLKLIIQKANQSSLNAYKYAQSARLYEMKAIKIIKKLKIRKHPTKQENESKKIQLLKYVEIANNASQNAFKWSQKATVFADLAHNFESDILKKITQQQKYNEAIYYCHLEIQLLTALATVLNVCFLFTEGEFAKPRSFKDNENVSLFGISLWLTELEFIINPDNWVMYAESDIRKMDKNIISLIGEYAQCDTTEFVIRNEHIIIDKLHAMFQAFPETSLLASKVMIKYWQKHFEIKQTTHFDIIRKLLTKSVKRFEKNFKFALSHMPKLDVLLDIYDCECKKQPNVLEKWIKTNSLPTIIAFDALEIETFTFIWINTCINTTCSLFEFFSSDINKAHEILTKFSYFQLDINMFKQLYNIINVIELHSMVFVNQLKFLINLGSFDYLQVISDQLLKGGLPKNTKIHSIVLSYYYHDDINVIELISSVLKLTIIQDIPDNLFFSYFIPLANRLLGFMSSTNKELTKKYLQMWTMNKSLAIPLLTYRKWSKKYSIPQALVHLIQKNF